MKKSKLLLLLFFLCFTILSCSDDDGPVTFNPLIIENPKLPYLLVNKGLAFSGMDKTQLVQGKHSSWTHATVAYDKEINKFVVFYNIKNAHEVINNKTVMRLKTPNGSFSNLQIVADRLSEGISNKTQASGIADNGDYISLVTNLNNSLAKTQNTDVYRSKDKGITWDAQSLMINEAGTMKPFLGWVEGFLVLKSGRILTLGLYQKQTRVLYSDDNGYTWNYASMPNCYHFEPAWCELSDGTIICYMRSTVGANPKIKEPAYFTKSLDNGLTWELPVPSKSIINMTEANGHLFYHEDIGKVEFVYHSRFPERDGHSSIYQCAASENDAKNDNMGEQFRIHYLPQQGGGDSGYIGGAISSDSIMNIFYYAGTKKNADIYYMEGQKNSIYYNSNTTEQVP
ncbi:exo-alpha-sialidase [Dysgonomonas sp. 521]|uniref:sialidase family protein n=1 Tax=Dysgonomonas sp. 521 TaxID=2302932 RepID=UPI0013D3E131|nr:sialidase family protein [Dysgonomonas sp. 521]NDV96119.1 exo-alpha-sialidase [Dysgonomonas sp. 521]